MKVTELRAELRARGLDADGKKAELEARLEAALSGAGAGGGSESEDDSSETNGAAAVTVAEAQDAMDAAETELAEVTAAKTAAVEQEEYTEAARLKSLETQAVSRVAAAHAAFVKSIKTLGWAPSSGTLAWPILPSSTGRAPRAFIAELTWGWGIVGVLRKVHPGTGIVCCGATAVDDMLSSVASSIIEAATRNMRARQAQRVTERDGDEEEEEDEKEGRLSSGDVQYAVSLILQGELAKHAVSEGVNAATKAVARRLLQFSPSIVGDLLMRVTRHAVDEEAGVCFAAVLEYICGEILELSGNAARDNRRPAITGRCVFLACANDEELIKLFGGKGGRFSVGSGSMVMPNIHAILLPHRRGQGDSPRVPSSVRFVAAAWNEGRLSVREDERSAESSADRTLEAAGRTLDVKQLDRALEGLGPPSRDTMQNLEDAHFAGLALRAGVLQWDSRVCEELRGIAQSFLENTLRAAFAAAQARGAGPARVLRADVHAALRHDAAAVYGLGAQSEELRASAGRPMPTLTAHLGGLLPDTVLSIVETCVAEEEGNYDWYDEDSEEEEQHVSEEESDCEEERYSSPHERCLNKIREMQRSHGCVLPFCTAARLFHGIGGDYVRPPAASSEALLVSPEALLVLSTHLEVYLVLLLVDANLNGIHARRTWIEPKDLYLARRIRCSHQTW